MEVNKKQFEASVDCLQQAMTLIDIAFTKLTAMEDINASKEWEKKMENDDE